MKTYGKYVTYKMEVRVRLHRGEAASDLDEADILKRGEVMDFVPDSEEPDYGED